MKVLLVFWSLKSTGLLADALARFIFSSEQIKEHKRNSCVRRGSPDEPITGAPAQCRGSNLTVSYNLKTRARRSPLFFPFFLLSRRLRPRSSSSLTSPSKKRRQHKSSVSLKAATIRGRLASFVPPLLPTTAQHSERHEGEGRRGRLMGSRIQVRQGATAQLIRGGDLGAGRGQTGHFLACSGEPFIWMEMSAETIRSTAPG